MPFRWGAKKIKIELSKLKKYLSGDSSGHGGGIELNGVSSSVSLDESVEVPVGALGGGTGNLKAGSSNSRCF